MSRRRPRKPTPAYLERVALWYLERWFTTRKHLRRKLVERVNRGIAEHGGDRDEVLVTVDALLDKLERAKVLDDWRYVRGKVASLRRRGDSRRAIQGKLAAKSADRDMVDRALAEVSGEDGELLSAIRYVRRRRLGPYRLPEKQEEQKQKDLARLARAGFSFDVAKSALALDRDAIDDRVFSTR